LVRRGAVRVWVWVPVEVPQSYTALGEIRGQGNSKGAYSDPGHHQVVAQI